MPIFSGVGSPGTVAGASGGKVTPVNNLSPTPMQVVGINPQRRTITFHNPHASIGIYIAPMLTATGAPLVPMVTQLGGCYSVYPGAVFVLDGECQGAYQAFSASGFNIPLTITESNV